MGPTARMAMSGVLVGLCLAAVVRAQDSGGGAIPLRATLLPGSIPIEQPAPRDGEAAPPAPLDVSVLPAGMQDAGSGQPAAPDEAPPSVEPLPAAVAQAIPAPARGGQANPPARAPLRVQGGSGQRPAPPAARPPAGTPPRTPPAQAPAAGATPAPGVDVEQQVQIDRSGLVTMHVNELDVRKLLEFLSRRSGSNILVSPKVSGPITANFEGVTVEKVLDAIIKLANLTDKKEGAIHYIYTKEELQDEAEFTKKERILTKVYKLNYVRADEILGVIRPFLSHDVGQKRIAVTPSYRFGISESATFVSGGGQQMSAGGGGGGVAAAGGTGGPGGAPPTGGGPTIGGFQPPTGGNSLADFDHLIIQDYESNLLIIDQIIQRVDVRPVQVLIEAVIISVDYEHQRELGVNLGLVDSLGQTLGTIGSGTGINGNVGFAPTRLLTTGGQLAQGVANDAQGFTSSTNGVKFGFVSNNVTGFIRALETIGSTKILASPRILVLNKQRAEIQLGTRLGFQTLSQNFTSTIQQVQFLNTGTLLRLRPFVSDDGMVRMEIHPERSSGTVTNNIPNQNTAELTTNVMVPDGSTLVIGGLIEDEDDASYQGLPGMSRWPALSFLTGINQKVEGRRELVVLLTPHIWSGEPVMSHAPAAGSIPGAFAVRTLPNGTRTFDLETGPSPAPANEPTRPAADPSAVAAVAPTPAAATSPANPAATPAPAPSDPGVSAATATAAAPDPREQPATRHRRGPIREWLSRRSRDRRPAEGVDLAHALPAPPGPAQGTPPAVAAPGQTAGAATGQTDAPADPGAVAIPSPEAGQDLTPTVSPQQFPTLPPDLGHRGGSESLLSVPMGMAAREQAPRRDPMLGRAAWSPDRAEARSPLRGWNDPDEAGEARDVRPRGVVAGPRRHTIAAGETLEAIARRYYGSRQYAGSLGEYNRGRIARAGLRPGDLLVIPPRESLPTVGGWAVQNAPEARPGSVAARPDAIGEAAADRVTRPSARPRAIDHVVGPDETPRSIARDRLGDPGRAAEIVQLNRRLLAKEGRWRPGLRILLPPDAR